MFKWLEVDQGDSAYRNAIRQAIKRKKDSGIIQADPDRAGRYRRIEQSVECSDLWEGIDDPSLDVRLPLGADSFVEILPKDIVIFAGVINSGKSAMMIETLRLNMIKWDCHFFSSEMSRKGFATRLDRQEDMKREDWKLHFYSDWDHDHPGNAVIPDALCFF